MFALLTGRSSLRDIASQFGAKARRPYHLGVKGVKRSTLSDANQDRPAEFFESVFHHLYAKCFTTGPQKRFRFKRKLYSFDSTVMELCLSLFPWAGWIKQNLKIKTFLVRAETPCSLKSGLRWSRCKSWPPANSYACTAKKQEGPIHHSISCPVGTPGNDEKLPERAA